MMISFGVVGHHKFYVQHEDTVLMCPTSANGVRVDVLSYLINGVYAVISATEGCHLTYMPVFCQDNIIEVGIDRRVTGNFVPNILRRGTMNKFCSDED